VTSVAFDPGKCSPDFSVKMPLPTENGVHLNKMERFLPVFNELAIQDPEETIPVVDLGLVYRSFENDDLLKKGKDKHLLSENDGNQKSPSHGYRLLR